MLGKRLEIGDTIGIVSPASIETDENIKLGIKRLEELGFRIKKGRYIYEKFGYLAGKDEYRAQDVSEMFMDRDVKMILCIRGGYGAMRLLPYFNFSVIRKSPKLFVGYSDITVLLNSFYEREGLITFHGPMLSSNLYLEDTLESLLTNVMEGYKEYSIINPKGKPIISNMDRSVTAELVGGNLSLICSTLGTPYEINTKNRILFLEEVQEAPYKIDRMLTQLKLSGKLEQCKGLIIGQFTNCEGEAKDNGFTLKEVLEDRLLKLDKPFLMDVMCGHDNPKLTLPIGAKCKMNCKNGSIDVLEPVCKK